MKLANPEHDWERPTAQLNRDEVERRIGRTSEPLAILTGGLANLNVAIGTSRVLRIHLGEPDRVAKEAALLRQPWRSFRVPSVLATGDDFLLLELVACSPLTQDHGAEVGRALAEIHSRSYAACGVLAADLSLQRRVEFSLVGYGRHQMDAATLGSRCARILAFLEAHAASADDYVPVLSHCDFKLSNLHWTDDGRLLVLDWEFAWAGPPLLDVGQLLRWQPPPPFVDAFAQAYVAGGGQLVEGWQATAEAIDLCNLLGLLARGKGERRRRDLLRRIDQTLG